jgi:hypothetical protein
MKVVKKSRLNSFIKMIYLNLKIKMGSVVAVVVVDFDKLLLEVLVVVVFLYNNIQYNKKLYKMYQ